MFKGYTRKASAQIGAKRAGIDVDAVVQKEGIWGFYLPDDTASQSLPKLSGAARPAGQSRASAPNSATVLAAAATVADTIATRTVQMMEKVNDTLGDIKNLIFEENKREEENDKSNKLKQLESDREKTSAKPAPFAKFMDGIKDKAGGLFSLLKGLSIPLILGALTGLDENFKLLKEARIKIGVWAADLQENLNAIADLPLFKDNILGKGIRNLIPIAGGFSLLAIWKPGLALKMLKGITAFTKFFGNNPAVKGLEKLPSVLPALESFGKFGSVLSKIARIGGKIFLPITVVTSLWETISGAIDGWKNGGIAGALEGALDGLVHGLIGGLVDTLSQGIGWVLEQFGVEAEGFKNFKFGAFLDALGSNLASFLFELVQDVKETFGQAVDQLTSIFSKDNDIFDKMKELVTWPLSFIISKFKELFEGKSLKQIVAELMTFGTGNNAVAKAVYSASRPTAPSKPSVNIIDGSNPSVAPPTKTPPSGGISASLTGSGRDSADIAASMLRKHEGFAPDAYWDVNAYRAGYGSDTVTRADGSVERVTKDTKVTRADAERDLARRLKEFQKQLANEVGMDNWNALNEQTKAALTSVGYNYGSFKNLKNLRAAIATRDTNKIADAVAQLQNHNAGVNRKRRLIEAADIRASVNAIPKSNTGAMLATTSEQVNDAKAAKQSNAGLAVAPVNASRTNVTNQTTNNLPSLSASTPIEFAPHVA